MSFEKIFSILDWLKDKLPIQDRKERWKNELDNLEKEKKELKHGEWTQKKGERLRYIDARCDYLNQLLRNSNKG